MKGTSDKAKSSNKLFQLAAPLLETTETPSNLYAYQSNNRTSTSNAYAASRLDIYSLAQLSSVSLSYSPDEKYSKLLATKENNNLFLQANVHTALFALVLAIFPFEMFCCQWLRGALGSNFVPLVFSVGLYSIWQCAWAWQTHRIRANRLQKSDEYLKVPDRLMLNSDGIQLVWSSKYSSFAAYAVRWSKMRLVYLEHDDTEDGHFICIRTSSGGLLRMHSSGFSSEDEEKLLSMMLLQRAPQACKEPPKYLAVQPERTSTFALRWSWLKLYCLDWLKAKTPQSCANTIPLSFLSACWKQLQASQPRTDQENLLSVEAMANQILARDSRCELSNDAILQNGRYKILKQLHHSFDFVAYLAEASDPAMGNRVFSTYTGENDAIKFGAQVVSIHEYAMPPASESFFDCEDLYSKLLSYIALCTRMDNKRIARWLDHFMENGRSYVVFEHCPGNTIRQHVAKNGPFSERQALSVALQIADILSYLHSVPAPIMHGDLSPDAFTIDESGEIKLSGTPRFSVPVSKNLGGPMGRPAYMAPEFMRGSLCKQSDLYSFGGTLFFMLTGEDPQILQKSQPKLKVDSLSETMNSLVSHATEQELPKRLENIDMLKRQLIQSEAEHLITRLIS